MYLIVENHENPLVLYGHCITKYLVLSVMETIFASTQCKKLIAKISWSAKDYIVRCMKCN